MVASLLAVYNLSTKTSLQFDQTTTRFHMVLVFVW